MANGRDMFSEFYSDFHESGVRDGSDYIKKQLGPSGDFNEKVEWRQTSPDRVERVQFGMEPDGRKFYLRNTFDFLAQVHFGVLALEDGIVAHRYDFFSDIPKSEIQAVRKWLNFKP